MTLSHARHALEDLYRIVEAGEKGYAVVASNVRNRALKLLFLSCVQQRRRFKEELFEQIQQLGGGTRPRGSGLGMLHRGRIDIFAHFTIGDQAVERVLTREVLVGERAALRAYERAVAAELPPEAHELVERQLQELRNVVQQMILLYGQNGKRLVLRLYDARPDAEQAFKALREAGVAEEAVQVEEYRPPALDPYEGRGTTLLETVLAGIVGVELWGLVSACFAAVWIIVTAARSGEQASWTALIMAMLLPLGGAVFIGGMLGLFVGWGVTSQDQQLSQAVPQGQVLMQGLIDESLASRAWNIMNQAALAARARHVNESPA